MPHDSAGHTPIDMPDDPDARIIRALKALLIGRGFFSADDVRRKTEELQSPAPARGAALVAAAWSDPIFRAHLLADGKVAVVERGVPVLEAGRIVVENTPSLHNLITCTLCSCYPRSLLGQPPPRYTSKAYRARSVRDPRGVLAELGWTPPRGIAIRVHDSTADMRYLVLPRRPEGTEGWPEGDLARLVTRDSMIGVAPALSPSAAGRTPSGI
jgi:nitrile hydratase